MPLSYSSSKSDIKAFFKFEFDNDVMWWLNDKIEFQSVDRLVEEARIRSVWATGRAQHWMRQAVADANSSASLRGAGVLFAPAQWDAENSAWGNRPFVWNAYRHPTTDPVQAKRQAECPRAAHLDRLRTLRNQIVHHLSAFGGAFPSAAELRKLAADLGGPWPVLRYLERLAKGDSNRQEDLVGLRGAVDAEIHRIRRALIASFLHPNGKGADRYAETAVRRVRDHLALSAQVRQDERPGGQPVATPATGGETNSELLARFGLRSDGTLLADIGHLRVDSICLTVVTERASEAALTPNISLVVRRRKAGRTAEWVRQLNFPYQLRPPGSGLAGTAWVVKLYPHFEPAATNRFTVVVEDEQPLAEITGMALRMGPDPAANDSRPHGTVWRPRRVMLEINGRVVQELTFRARAVPAGGELNLRYPPRRRQSGDGQLSGR